MSLKQYKPNTPGQRGLVLVGRESLHKGKPFKKLTKGLTKNGGRNNFGHLTSRKQGGGHKKKYRIIDFKRNLLDSPAVVERIEYDPNRSAFIALVLYQDGERKYIIAPKGIKEGSKIMSGSDAEISIGNTLELENIPVGTTIHCVELKPQKGAQLARSAGTSVQFVAKITSKEIKNELPLDHSIRVLPYSEKEGSKKIIGNIKEVKITIKKAIHLSQTGKYIYLF